MAELDQNQSTHDFYRLSKKIAHVYFSNLRFKLKNDCVCRLISDTFPGVSAMSILLYESKEDALINFGHYLNPELAAAVFNEKSIVSEVILKNISLFEYFAFNYELNDLVNCSYTDFNAYPYFKTEVFHGEVNQIMTAEVFEKIQQGFTNEVYTQYLNYKATIARKDVYSLENPDTMSGRYFHDLVINAIDEKNKHDKFAYSYEIEHQNKILNRVYEDELFVKIGGEYSYYAIPLYVSKRFIGIIRFIAHVNIPPSSETKEFPKYLFNHFPNHFEKNGFHEIADMIALHIENDYGSYELRKNNKSKPPKFSEYADMLSDAINCKACIIRGSELKDGRSHFLGWTNYVDKYVARISEHDHFIEGKMQLKKLFNLRDFEKKSSDNEIIAFQFEVSSSRIENVAKLYFSKALVSTAEINAISENSLAILKNFFKKDLLYSLEELKLNFFLIVKIPGIDESYITFANTKFRPIITKDLDIVYPQINRLGSELFIKQGELLNKKADLLSTIYHELETPVQLAFEKANTLIVEIDELLDLPPYEQTIRVGQILTELRNSRTSRPKEFMRLMEFIDSRFKLLTITNDVDRNLKFPKLSIPYKFVNEIEGYISIFKEYANKRFKIQIVKNWNDSIGDYEIHQNDEIFLGLFMYLMRNALKYSYHPAQRQQLVPDYSQYYEKESDGHIKVTCFIEANEIGYIITNWGKKILKENIKDIFKLGYRCPIDPEFEASDNPIKGQGIGLYYAKKFADIISANITVSADGPKTEFRVSWKK
ncbi:hypothetical protein KXD93_25585 [Mucilaginibacter sp. BJC16-A38]|uniref:hypothetical protein n=1 Tax=Mucilaginibacter phenanthrenivorans TaxID=1234842 RepID=UPI0021573308|nr:hypothetical protein [Mucilaginibacter phenanthrenivorans]MCR8561055.1 hypothetical protein [Mucilaginibacter phenanthrenivorans]